MAQARWYIGSAIAVTLILISGGIFSFALGFAASSKLAIVAFTLTVVAAFGTGVAFMRRGRSG